MAGTLFYSAMLLTGVNLLLRLVGTSFQVYLSGRIGAEGIGLLQLVMSIGSMALVAGMAGIRTAAMYLSAEQAGKKQSQNDKWIISGCLTYSFLFSGAVGAGVYLAAPILAEGWIGSPQTVDAIRLFAAFLPVNCMTGVMVGFFTGSGKVRMLAAIEVLEQLCTIGCTIGLLSLWAEYGAARSCQAVVLGSCAGSCICLLCLTLARLLSHAKTGPKIPVASRVMHVSLPLALADDLRTGISTAENILVPKRLALYPGLVSPLAAYGTICGMVFPLLMFPTVLLFGLTELLIPELARCNAAGSTGRIHYLVNKSLHVSVLYGTLCAGLLYLNADTLCEALYSGTKAGKYLRMFSVLAVMLYCDAVTDAMIKGLGKQKISVRYNILTNTMDVGMLYLLLPAYGISGYFFSFVLTHLVNFILSIRLLMKISNGRISLVGALISVLCGLAAAFAARFLVHPFQKTAAFLTLFFCLMVLAGGFRKQDLKWILGLICKKGPKA